MEPKEELPVTEVESGDSSTEEAELESPRSVVLQMKKKLDRVLHSQVLRIRQEDSHLGQDFIAAGDKAINKSQVVFGGDVNGGGGGVFTENTRRSLNLVLVSKPILPSSPLSGKNSVKKALK
ncbi:hypothetical protein J1N35_019378 [Gossypium stocksii]|uniref:Uncharacterized protein n=1 Tax=Gossypium stocksii TaxID=47602 RepID=A0A9D3VQU2_9ROSI|nr:hypothetical protein J1N35_019378 [Gossypium stocksii]